jgi:mono/diheme cytochrome c family protein
VLLSAARGADDPAAAHFLDHVRPLLAARCVSCHGPDKQKGKLRLDSREALLKGGETGPAIVPGDAAKSLLLQVVRHELKDLKMPPKEKLSVADIAVLERWVKDGAPMAAEAAPIAAVAGQRIGDAWSDKNNPIVKIFRGERLDLWSLRPVKPAAIPEVKRSDWTRNEIDRFVLAKLEEAGLPPSREADRRTLIRRLSFDLIGLPPGPDEVEAFEQDKSADAYEKLVERLLASRHYGERWARHWLDVVRYADTMGFERDELRPQTWRYRDYVIRSFNADKPYDRFIREQLAGDEMVQGPPRDAAEADALIATGFLRLGQYDSTASIFQEDKKGRNELMADLANTTGSAFLGLTIACANCHDHKYDPISQADHFRLRAFFAAVKFRDDLIVDTAVEREAIDAHNAALDVKIAEYTKQVYAKIDPVKERIAAERRATFPAEIQELLKADPKKRDEATKKTLKPYLDQLKVKGEDAFALLSDEDKKRDEDLWKQINELKGQRRDFTRAMAMSDEGPAAPKTHLFFQGDFTEPRQEVAPGFLSVFDPNDSVIARPAAADTTGRRTALANWIASPDNPYTARVMVNRLWQHHFGVGLVATPNDFGTAGARPTNQPLLDFLAGEFVRSGWSIKQMHRLMVNSATYRQASTGDRSLLDPDNALLARQNARRLSADAMRDAMLSVSGAMFDRDGGRPLWPPVPEEMLHAQPSILETKADKGAQDRLQGWYADPPEQTDARSIYLVQKRCLPLPFMQAFDLPETTVSCGRRDVTTVAPQALNLLNDEFALRMAKAFAQRVAKEAGEDNGKRVERAVWLALGRGPSGREKAAAMSLLGRHTEAYAKEADAPMRALVDVCRALMNVNEFVYVD